MVIPRLAHFINPAPKSFVSNAPPLWLEHCLAGGTEFLVLVDHKDFPVRVLLLHHLLSIVEEWTASTPTTSVSPTAPARDSFEEPLFSVYTQVTLSLISIRQSSETAAQMIAAAPSTCWVVVDQQQRYVGLLDKTRLLALALMESPAPAEFFAEAALVSGPADEKDHQYQLFSEQQLSESNTALLTYLGHELKTPLTSLLGLSSLLSTERIGPLNPRQSRYVGLIQQHCRRLTVWVNTLIDLGRVESGTLKLVPQMVNLSALWEEAYRQAALRIGQEKNPKSMLPPLLNSEELSFLLVADPSRLQQMLACLMQPGLATQSSVGEATQATEPPLRLEVWDNWIAFISQELEEDLCLDLLSQTTFRMPFPATSPATPLTAENGHWLEWLLVRKLAQLHGGEIVLMGHPHYGVCPVLLMPITPAYPLAKKTPFVLCVAPAQVEKIKLLQQQTTQLNHRLLITHSVRDAVEISKHISLVAIAVFVEGPHSVRHLSYLQNQLPPSDQLTIALVSPQRSSLLGDLPADRELLWPGDSLGSVLLQPPAAVPPPNRLTVLYLKTATEAIDPVGQHAVQHLRLPGLFHDFGCRVLEVDDLEQAALLRRVWKPNVAVIAPDVTDPAAYLHTLSRLPDLRSLPIITLTMTATQAGHHIESLKVFPCLVGETPWDTPDARDRMATWLIQVLQAAAVSPP